MAGYFPLKSLSLRDRRWTRPPVLIASARKPSSFNSYYHCPPSDSFSEGCKHRFDEVCFGLQVQHQTSLPHLASTSAGFDP
jgi:hypothetical protein